MEDPAKLVEQVKVRHFSSKQKREELTRVLPEIRAKRRDISTIRHRGYNQETADRLLGAMCEGHTLTDACDMNAINRSTVHRWIEGNPAFAAAYARAREHLAEHCFTQALEIPKQLYAKVQAGTPVDGPTVGAARLLVDTLKWYSEKLNPRLYGQQKQTLEVSGSIAVASVLIDSRSLSQEARDGLRMALLQSANTMPAIEHDENECGTEREQDENGA